MPGNGVEGALLLREVTRCGAARTQQRCQPLPMGSPRPQPELWSFAFIPAPAPIPAPAGQPFPAASIRIPAHLSGNTPGAAGHGDGSV